MYSNRRPTNAFRCFRAGQASLGLRSLKTTYCDEFAGNGFEAILPPDANFPLIAIEKNDALAVGPACKRNLRNDRPVSVSI